MQQSKYLQFTRMCSYAYFHAKILFELNRNMLSYAKPAYTIKVCFKDIFKLKTISTELYISHYAFNIVTRLLKQI